MSENVRRFSDARGTLAVVEHGSDVAFGFNRAYWLTGLDPAQPRGFHAHHRTRQFAVCIQGCLRMVMEDPGHPPREVTLFAGGAGLVIEAMVWHEMHDFSTDCILLVLADQVHEEADYIRDRATWEAVTRG